MNARNRSLIINVGSESGEYPHRGFSVYASTKAYTDHLSKCLNYQFAGSNVDVVLFEPGPTDTPLLKNVAPDIK